jgi:hypothetical protein
MIHVDHLTRVFVHVSGSEDVRCGMPRDLRGLQKGRLDGCRHVKGVGLFWPYPNHTVAVWELHPADRPAIRMVVPTSQIFLDASDSLDTRKFNAWSQKSIYEYSRRDVPDSFELPGPLVELFVTQVDKYAGASDATLQQLRYLRESVFLKRRTPEEAAREALRLRDVRLRSAPDPAAFQSFAQDMRSAALSHSAR